MSVEPNFGIELVDKKNSWINFGLGDHKVGKITGKTIITRAPNREPTINWENLSLEEIKVLEKYVKSRVDPPYRNITYFPTNSARAHFLADWGPQENPIKIIWKVDKQIYTSIRAKRHFSNGCDTQNEIDTNFKIPDPEAHGIIPIFDFREPEGKMGALYAEKFYSGFKSLDEIVLSASTRLEPIEWESYAEQLLHSANHYVENGYFHNDHKPSNHLIKKYTSNGKKKVKLWITDTASGSKTNCSLDKLYWTAGGHMVMDPLLLKEFNSQDKYYQVDSEIFELGVSMLYAGIGQYAWEFDQDLYHAKTISLPETKLEEKLTSIKSGLSKFIKFFGKEENPERNLVNEDSGRFDIDKKLYHKHLNKALRKLPSDLKRFRPVLRKMLTLDESKRYQSMDELIADFEKYQKKTPFKQKMKRALITTTAIALIGGSLYAGVDKILDKKDVALLESKKTLVNLDWDEYGPKLINDFFSAKPWAYNESAWINSRSKNLDNFPKFPDNTTYLKAKPGDFLTVGLDLKELPKNNTSWIPTLAGRVYLEGVDSVYSFNVGVNRNNNLANEYMLGGYYSSPAYIQDIEVPKGMKSGSYNLTFEVYAPRKINKKTKKYEPGFENIRFKELGRTIYSESVPILVGDAQNISVSGIGLNVTYMRVRLATLPKEGEKISFDKSNKFMCEVYIPELNFKDTVKSNSGVNTNTYLMELVDIPYELDGPMDLTLRIRTMDRQGQILGECFHPLRSVDIRSGEYKSTLPPQYYIDHGLPTREFSKNIVKYSINGKLYSKK